MFAMLRGRDHLHAFVGRVHRRLLAVRLLESVGLGLLAGAVATLILLPILLYRGQEAFRFIGITLPLGIGGGLVWALLRRPRVMTAVAEADRQLKLDDLLSTAWVLRDCADQEFAAAVMASAEECCSRLSPSSVILSRFSSRGWGGIALATAMVFTLGLISANPLDPEASAAQNRSIARSPAHPAQTQHAHWVATAGAPQTPFMPDRAGNDNTSLNPNDRLKSESAKGRGQGNAQENAANPQGTGGGSARSANTGGTDPLAAAGGTHNPSKSGDTGGGGAPGGASGTGQGASGSTIGATPAPAPPAWKTPAWPTAASAAEHAVRNGEIPAQYHDLIREYFDEQN